MALQDHQPLLQALVGMQGAKRSNDRQQFDIWKNAYENRLLAKQISDAESENKKLQSEYDKAKQANEEYAKQLDVTTNVQRILQDGWQPQDAGLLASYNIDPQVIKLMQQENWRRKFAENNPQLAHIAGLSMYGDVSGSALETATQNALVPEYSQNQQNIEQTNAQTAQTNAQTALTQAQTAQQKTLQSEFALIDSMSANPQQKTLAKLAKAGVDAQFALMLDQFKDNPEYINAWILAKASASQRIQEHALGLQPEPQDPNQIEIAREKQVLENQQRVIDALTYHGYPINRDADGKPIVPKEAASNPAFQQTLQKMIASEYSEMQTKSTSTAGTGSSVLQRDTARNLINSIVPRLNRSFAEGESVEFGTTMALIEFSRMLENARTLENFDWNMLGYAWAGALGEVAQVMGTKAGENPNAATMAQVFANGGQLQNIGYRLTQIASQNNGTLPFDKLPDDIKNEMIKVVLVSQSLTNDPVLLNSIKKMVGGEQIYNSIIESAKPKPPPPKSEARLKSELYNEAVERQKRERAKKYPWNWEFNWQGGR